MKKWPIIVAGLYGLTLLVLFGPLLWVAFLPARPKSSEWLFTRQAWVIVGVMMLMQYALLRIPVQTASQRPVKQRSLWSTVIAAALMMAVLVFGAAVSIYEFITQLKGDADRLWICAGVGLASWVFWTLYFHRSTKRFPPDHGVKRMQRCLWSGSILELLIAIPTHIVARHRGYCCAGLMTFVGLACGFSVVIFAFGPSLFFLFAGRWQRLHPTSTQQG